MGLERAAGMGLAARLFGSAPERTLALLRAAWPRVVGPELARRTEVIALEGDSLRIRVPDAGWRKGLLRMRREILTRLRDLAGDLAPRRLGFTEGFPAGTAPSLPPIPPPAPEVPAPPPSPALSAEAARIRDPELRARFLEIAGRYLARTKHPPTP
jgi:hypothetical protein